MSAKQLFLSVPEYARRHHVSRQRVYLWIKAGRLPARKIRGTQRVPATAPRPDKKKAGRPQQNPAIFATIAEGEGKNGNSVSKSIDTETAPG